MASPTIWMWLVWGLSGVLIALAAYAILPSRRLGVFDFVLGIVGCLCGGFGSALAAGVSTPGLFIVSELVALLVGAAILWIYNQISIRMTK